jgi:hypothetical protein
MPAIPELVAAHGAGRAALRAAGSEHVLDVGGTLGAWTLRAVWREGEASFAALESTGEIVFLCSAAPRVRGRLRRPFGRLKDIPPLPQADVARCQALLDASEDVLAREAWRDGEPTFAGVAGLLPPLLDMTFLGDEHCEERAVVRPDGAMEGYFEAAFEVKPGARVVHGLLAETMNAVCYGAWDERQQRGVEMVAFALADGPAGELTVYRRLRTVCADGETVGYERSCGGEVAQASEFYRSLQTAYLRHTEWAARGMQVRLPETEVRRGVVASLRLTDLAFRGVLPRYGVGYYDRPEHNSFPPAVLFFSWAMMEWGRLDRARDALSHCLGRYVKPDGTFDYYGPAVAEYGQLLAAAARYLELSADRQWWDHHLVILHRIVRRLVALRHEAIASGPPELRGLIPGLPEADYHGDAAEWQAYYFAGDVWVCRGLREVGRALLGDAGTCREGGALLAEADAYRADIRAAVKAATHPSGFVPAGPAQPPPFERMTESRHASYCNYRYLLEMASAGVLEAATIRAMARYRRAHGGELLGTTRFAGHLDDWPAWHWVRGLLDTDDVAGYLNTFYGHLAYHHSHGNWASYEQVTVLPGERGVRTLSGRAEQVVPCQAMAALMLKQMLVDDDRDADVLHLLRACPTHWLTAPAGVEVKDCPTRWGPVSVGARMHGDEAEVKVRGLARGVPGKIRVRLAVPGRRIAEASADSVPAAVTARGQVVVVERPTLPLTIRARLA